MKERALIERIRKLAGSVRQDAVMRGIGDDCAVLRVGAEKNLLVTTDFSIEDVHFRRQWHPADSVGHRCLARGLSDIASMGGTPLACFLSLGLPGKLPQKWIDDFFRGLQSLARQFHVQLAGGDLSSAPKIIADIMVLGQIPAGKAVLRSGARAGDRIYVTGALGGSAATLKQLFAGKKIKAVTSSPHFYPQPRIAVGRWLQQRGLATAMIDLSDGLSVDLAHICQESGVSAQINAADIPIAKGANLELALHGGEDYELLFTAPPKAKLPRRIAGVPVTEIGVIRKPTNYSSAIQILGENGKVQPLQQAGWEHFKS
jgi:thiamine-monophosphate kinase